VYCHFTQGSILLLLYAADVIELVEQCGLITNAFANDLQSYGHTVSANSVSRPGDPFDDLHGTGLVFSGQ